MQVNQRAYACSRDFRGFFRPGTRAYLTFWYLKSELSLRIAAYAGMNGFNGIFGGLIAYGLGNTSGLLLQGRQILFAVEGPLRSFLGS